MKIEVKDFTIIPESCPRNLIIGCAGCKYAEQPFILRNPRNLRGSYGKINCKTEKG